MNKFVLLALVGCSLAVFMHTVVSEEPFEPFETKQANDFGAVKDETVDATADEGFEDDVNDDDDFDEDEEADDPEDEEAYHDDEEEGEEDEDDSER